MIAGVAEIAVTVVGKDRPGIIARTAELLSELGMNLEDSSMTRLRGHFAMTLICLGDAEADRVEQVLSGLADDSLEVTVRTVQPGTHEAEQGAESWLVSVYGADRLGIVARIAAVIAAAGGNITDLTTRHLRELYVLSAEVDLVGSAEALQAELRRTGADLGVQVSMEPLSDDEL